MHSTDAAGKPEQVFAAEDGIQIDTVICRSALKEGIGVVPGADPVGLDAELGGFPCLAARQVAKFVARLRLLMDSARSLTSARMSAANEAPPLLRTS